MEGKKDLVADFLFNNKVNIFSLSETFLSHKNFTDVEIGGYSFEYQQRCWSVYQRGYSVHKKEGFGM